MGSPWSPATPGAKYWGALIPLEAVSMGRPGMEMGAPGRPGFASRTWSWMTMLCAGSGVVTDGAEATTVIDWWSVDIGGRRDRRRRSDNSNRLVDGGELSGCAPLCVIKLFCSGGVSRFLVGSWWVLIAPQFGEIRPARAELIFSGRGMRLT